MKSSYGFTCTCATAYLHCTFIISINKFLLWRMKEQLPFIHIIIQNTLQCVIVSKFNKTTLIVIAEQLIFIFFCLSFLYLSNNIINILSVKKIIDILKCICRKILFEWFQIIQRLNKLNLIDQIFWDTNFKPFFFINITEWRWFISNRRFCIDYSLSCLMYCNQLASLSVVIPYKFLADTPVVGIFMSSYIK